MPVIKRPTGTITLTPRTARVAAEYDVLVVGGGPAGLGAAMGAADAGASVALAERYGFLGGNATAALVTTLVSYHTWSPPAESSVQNMLFPADHGPGEPVIAGVLGRLVEKMVKRGGAVSPSSSTGYVVPFDPEIFKLVSLEMLDEAGVNFLFHAFASGVVSADKEMGVVFETKSGPIVIKAKVIIDCTGDGDVCFCAGAPYEVGEEPDSLTEPMTLMFLMTGFQRAGFESYVKEHSGQWNGVQGLTELVRKATEEGNLNLTRENILFFGAPHDQDIVVNSTRITRVLGTDVWDLTYAEWEGRRQMSHIAYFLRRYVPGFEKARIAQSGFAGVRETRRILCDYKLTTGDVLKANKFEDVIARGSYPVDMHNPLGKGTVIERIPPGEAYDIPLRSLLPAGIENLLVAGRCISGTHEAQASYRVMPICFATGQAAGVCAALAAARGKTPRSVAAADVQHELIRQGANLGNLR